MRVASKRTTVIPQQQHCPLATAARLALARRLAGPNLADGQALSAPVLFEQRDDGGVLGALGDRGGRLPPLVDD